MSHGGRAEGGSGAPLALRLSTLLADPLRALILSECHAQALSPRSFRKRFGGGSLAKTLQAFQQLERFGWLERVPPAVVAGPPLDDFDHLYRTTEFAILDADTWPDLPDSVKALATMRVLESLSVRTKEAMKAGTIDARDDSHLTWTPLVLDRQGWDTVIGRVDALFGSLFEEQAEAEARMAETGEEPISMTVALLAFESPR
jgi:hypothetical protein